MTSVDVTQTELALARKRIRQWPIEDRIAVTQLTEREARVIVLLTAVLDIRPVQDKGEQE